MRLLLGMVLLAALTACGSSNSDDKAGTSTNSGSGSPKCADVWVAGKTLPGGYDGCMNDDGSIEAFVTSDCEDGGELGSYDDRFWVRLPGGKITAVQGEMADDPAYKAAYDAC